MSESLEKLRPASNEPVVAADPKAAHDSARFIATISLSLGALMLALFGVIERIVTFERLSVEHGLALSALAPGIATLAFLACARAISWMISNMTFVLWRGVVPQHRWQQMQHRIEQSNQLHFRLTLMAGAYLLFTLVITALAATSAGLAFALSAPEFGVPPLPFAAAAGGVTALLVLVEMLTRDGTPKTALTAAYVGVLIVVMIWDALT